MYIKVSDNQAELVEPLVFTAFSVKLDAGAAPTPVDGVVRFESAEQAWVSASWLLAQEPYVSDAAAREGVEGMIGYARTKGWVDAETGEIAGHVVTG
jgi:hypothetical protein